MAAGSASKASWVVATSVGAVEALKDQAGLCRWNYVFRSLHQHAKTSVPPNNSRRMASSAAVTADSIGNKLRKERKDQESRQTEESLRKVMYLSCWGPN